MTYQVLARKYRPQTFADVVGQRGVTQTLRNALTHDRLAQAFVFAGPRGVGKTTTARILARALNCVNGPTPDPCGTCDACTEIAEGRDIDVLEIDAATHTQVENVREVIIAGLSTSPVRNRYKVFIIDEVHQLSSHSFNALLKSVEEPPPHVTFMMATTELGKIPETILSRSQVYEFRTIGRQLIAEQLSKIAAAESITIDDAAIGLIARAADGSMRDAQSAFDQVIAFAGKAMGVEDVSTVLGLIGRDPVLDVVEAVANEDPSVVFELAGQFIEAGYDLRLVCRELSRAVRDLMAIGIDAARASDPEIAAEGERDRLVALAARFSREDLLRAFDVIARAEFEIRSAAMPRYHLEMALLRWMHLRKLVPLTDLLQGAAAVVPPTGQTGGGGREAPASRPTASTRQPPRAPARRPPVKLATAAPAATPTPAAAPVPGSGEASGDPKAAVLAEIKRTKKFFYGTVVAQAQQIELRGDRMVFTFTSGQRTLAGQLEQHQPWLEATIANLVGRKVAVVSEQTAVASAPAETDPAPVAEAAPPASPAVDGSAELRARALSDTVVQSMLEVFPAEIDKVEEI